MPDKAKQVLLVEDEDNIALALSVLIEREGYIIDRVDDGDRAIETLNRSKPDLVVLEAMIPPNSVGAGGSAGDDDGGFLWSCVGIWGGKSWNHPDGG